MLLKWEGHSSIPLLGTPGLGTGCEWHWIFGLMLFASGFLQLDDLVVVTHPNTMHLMIEKDDIQNIYLNKKRRWRDGTRIHPVTLQEGVIHRRFLNAYIKKNSRQFSIFWKRVIFTGKGTPPTKFTTEAEVVAYIAQTPGSIGYVSRKAAIEGVRVLEIR